MQFRQFLEIVRKIWHNFCTFRYICIFYHFLIFWNYFLLFFWFSWDCSSSSRTKKAIPHSSLWRFQCIHWNNANWFVFSSFRRLFFLRSFLGLFGILSQTRPPERIPDLQGIRRPIFGFTRRFAVKKTFHLRDDQNNPLFTRKMNRHTRFLFPSIYDFHDLKCRLMGTNWISSCALSA